MKPGIYLFLLLIAFSNLCATSKYRKANSDYIVFLQKDKEILEQVFKSVSVKENKETGDLMIAVGTFFKETPYVAKTLEVEPEKEQLVINLREMDCNTFAENCLAISRTIKSGDLTFEKFAEELQNIRYRNGQINGYPSRLHYFSDWIYDNDRKNISKSVSKEIAGTPFEKTINFMSTHTESYIQLKDIALVSEIEKTEKEISARNNFYIPKEKLAQYGDKLNNGDIVGITTSIKGLDIMHVGILIRISGEIHLMHASSTAQKVIISENTLEEYLSDSKTASGIMISRPVN